MSALVNDCVMIVNVHLVVHPVVLTVGKWVIFAQIGCAVNPRDGLHYLIYLAHTDLC